MSKHHRRCEQASPLRSVVPGTGAEDPQRTLLRAYRDVRSASSIVSASTPLLFHITLLYPFFIRILKAMAIGTSPVDAWTV